MPRVKLDYVVSFSSEDPEHPASNLLQREVSKKKWLCKKGESSCSVVLQLPRTVKITGVHIGAYHAAQVEVLVGRAETSSGQFQVLVPSSVFISREEARRDAPVVRVRSFGADALSAPARAQRWDRVRLVCSQPHNKHCQFGLSFVHIDEAEGASCGAVPPRLLALDAFSSDEDDFKPGELFAKHLQNTSGEVQTNTSSNTGAQIRQATSQALKNIPESSTKLLKTPISKPAVSRTHSPPAARSDRARDALLYTPRDAEPHARIDRVLSRHERDKEHDLTNKTNKQDNTEKQNNANQKTKDDSKIKNETKTKDEPKRTPKRNESDSPPRPQRHHNKPTGDQNKEMRKRRRSSSQEQPIQGQAPGPVSAAPHTLLRGTVLVLSGYENPRRAAVRDLALALGARVQRNWGPRATHLICAFPNTPKLRALRAAAGACVPVARADWLEHVSRRRRLLPWRWYATEPAQRVRPTPAQLRHDDDPQPSPAQLPDDEDPQPSPAQLRDDDDPQPSPAQLRDEDDLQPDTRHTHQDPDSDGDTDDEIEKVLQAQKKRRLTESKTNHDAHKCGDSPVASDVTRTVSRDTEDEVLTDEEGAGPGPWPPGPAPSGPAPPGPALPHFFDGLTFAIAAAPHEARLMARYVRAYGGLVLEMSEVAEGSEVDYIVLGRSPHTRHVSDTRHVSAAWLASCHDAQARLPHEHTLKKMS